MSTTSLEEHRRSGRYRNCEKNYIDISYTVTYNGRAIHAGERVKFAGDYGIYRFCCLAHNATTDSTWVDVVNCSTGEYRSFDINRLRGTVVKRSYRKKVQTWQQ